MVTETLLVDRFILAGTVLKLSREVRYRRSENRTSPASAKDSLGAKNMEGNAFYETTKELDFIRNLSDGCFSVILLPTQVADIERWQIFAYNKATKLVDSFNIERGGDGFFNTQGTQLYTSPDELYKTSVLERKPGSCPFTGRPLMPIVSKSGHAEWALSFDSSDAHVNLGNPAALQITGDQTIEMWIKPTVLGNRYNPFNKSWGGEGTINLETDGKLIYWYGTSGSDNGNDNQGFSPNTLISGGSWVHIAIVRDLTNMKLHWYINGVASGSTKATYAAAKKSTQPVLIGKGYAGNFEGLIDEVRGWSRARSGSEIKETMNHRLIGNEFGLAGYWRFDEAAGTQVKDLTSNANHGTLSSDAVKWVASDAPIGEHPGMQRTSFAFGDREVDTGLAARLYCQQEKLSSEAKAKPVKQNARVLLTAVTSGLDPIIPVKNGLTLYLTGESYDGHQWNDLSGHDHHAFKHLSANSMPSLHQVANYNSKNFPVVRFHYNYGLQFSIPPLLAPFTAIIVDRKYTLNNLTPTLRGFFNDRATSIQWSIGKSYGNSFEAYRNGRKYPVGQHEASIINIFNINTGTVDGTSASWYLDGISKGTGTFPLLTDVKLYLGSEQLVADVACVLIWDRILTDEERQTVEKWLGTKYGIDVNHSTDLSTSSKKYVAAVDFDVSRAGKLAETPDTIPLPTLLSPDIGGVTRDGILGEISSLEIDIQDVQTEITTMKTEITTLNTKLQKDEAEIATIPTIERNRTQLIHQLTNYQRPRYATFYQHHPAGGSSFKLQTFDKRKALGWWSNRISALQWEAGLKIEAYDQDNYGGRKWTFPSNTDHSYNDKINSIKVLESDLLKKNRIDTNKEIILNDTKLASLRSKRDNQLSSQRNQLSQKNTLLTRKEEELNTKNARLIELQQVQNGAPGFLPMHQFNTDPQGLTVSSGLLGFAYTDSQPFLFDSALGRMAMYFKGANKQFFSAYYDVNTARARWSLVAGSRSVTLVSHATDSQVNDTTIVVADGADTDHCKVTLQNTKTGLTETWDGVPREVTTFATVLNGEVTEKFFIGKLSNDLSGTAKYRRKINLTKKGVE